jgi:hypothetical protein
MGLDFNTLSPAELLAAESAVLVMRNLTDAVKAAPHGKGMVCVETALHDKGFEHLRTMLHAAVASHAGAQKKGLRFAVFVRENRRVQTLQNQDGAEQRRAPLHRPAVLRLSALQGQAYPLGKLGRSEREALGHASCPADDDAGRQRLLI